MDQFQPHAHLKLIIDLIQIASCLELGGELDTTIHSHPIVAQLAPGLTTLSGF